MKAELKWLEDPRVFRINRLDAHSDHMYYGSEAEMEAGKSRFMQSLNGTWRFAWSRCPKERPADFFKEGMTPENGTLSRYPDIWNCRDMTKSTTSTPCTHGRAMCRCVRPILTGSIIPLEAM